VITEATTDHVRQEVFDHFLAIFNDIEAQAVPMARYDDHYNRLVIAFGTTPPTRSSALR
jgi:hypothetical protein